jgi:glycosyltransferase involved in cell wall biosynthesis
LLRALGTTPLRLLLAAPAGRRCALLVAQNENEGAVLRRYRTPLDVQPNVFLDEGFSIGPDLLNAVRSDGTTRHRAVFVGRLLAWKGVHLALAAMAEPTAQRWTLDFFGDGPERDRLERTITKAALSDRVRLLGRRPRDEVIAAMAQADALLFPSMREAAGWVVAEAMAVGCPVVCLDTGGPPLIAGDAGIAVVPGEGLPAALVRALDTAQDLSRSPHVRDGSELPALLHSWYEGAVSTSLPATVADA